MHSLVQAFQKKYIESLKVTKVDNFSVGDTVIVGIKIVDGITERIQDFQGFCIAKRSKGIGSNFIVRKITDDVEIERTVMLYSPAVAYVKVIRKGDVNRAKLYYLRGRRGKVSRIKEKMRSS
jgi:large subunit ribosomal protein L19